MFLSSAITVPYNDPTGFSTFIVLKKVAEA